MDLAKQPSPSYAHSSEYKFHNEKLLSLNEVMSFSEYVPTDDDKEHFRRFDRKEIEQLAHQNLGKQNASKNDIEFSRYKQDCRKRALDLAHSEMPIARQGEIVPDVDIISLADKYYNWLISIPQ